MNLRLLLSDTDAPDLGLPDVELTGLSEHTGEVEPGFGFCAVATEPETLAVHCEQAIRSGAAAILLEKSQKPLPLKPLKVPAVPVDSLARRRGELAARFYGDPSADVVCFGVTGTNGKTSIAYHIADLLSAIGVRSGYSGTLGWGQPGQLAEDGLTTANAVALQRRLAEFRDQEVGAVALEVSSHALAQGRASEVRFAVAVFSNLSHDHLDYHKTPEAYGEAKARLFLEWPLRAAVINVDDAFGKELAGRCKCPVITYGQDGDWRWTVSEAGDHVTWQTPAGEYVKQLDVVADYAVANLTAALAACVAAGFDIAALMDRVEQTGGVPGRMEVVRGQRSVSQPGPRVVVDYAHTPDALEKVLTSLKSACQGRLICVVGCGGDRDVTKRPVMGRIAGRLADQVWLTSDNPRSEDPAEIIRQMNPEPDDSVMICVERRDAIRAAVRHAGPGDVVLVAGKGHEPYQEIHGEKFPFDDRVESALALDERTPEEKGECR